MHLFSRRSGRCINQLAREAMTIHPGRQLDPPHLPPCMSAAVDAVLPALRKKSSYEVQKWEPSYRAMARYSQSTPLKPAVERAPSLEALDRSGPMVLQEVPAGDRCLSLHDPPMCTARRQSHPGKRNGLADELVALRWNISDCLSLATRCSGSDKNDTRKRRHRRPKQARYYLSRNSAPEVSCRAQRCSP